MFAYPLYFSSTRVLLVFYFDCGHNFRLDNDMVLYKKFTFVLVDGVAHGALKRQLFDRSQSLYGGKVTYSSIIINILIGDLHN